MRTDQRIDSRRRWVAVATALCAFAAGSAWGESPRRAAPVVAGDLFGTEAAPGSPSQLLGRLQRAGVTPQDLEYHREYSNGRVEYAFAPPAYMSPAPGFWPRWETAKRFLRENWFELGIQQSPGDFLYVAETAAGCDEAVRITLQQTYRGIPVTDSGFEVTVQPDHLVTHVEARFFPVAWRLPTLSCVPHPGELRIEPRPESPIIIVVVEDEVQIGRTFRALEPCSGSEMYSYDIFDPGR